jgi:hypothetical protein
MKTVIVYESMYGNTHLLAEQMAEAAGQRGEVVLVAVSHATSDVVGEADLVLVGGPTHVHGMSWETTRRGAIADAAKTDGLAVDPDAEGPGLRDWFTELDRVDGIAAAAFDTRMDVNPAMSGRASKGISRRLRHHGFDEIAPAGSFLVDKSNHLLPGEAERARAWAEAILDDAMAANAT